MKCISHKTSHPLAILICERPSAKRHRVLKLQKKLQKNPKTCNMQEAVSKEAEIPKKFTEKSDNSKEISKNQNPNCIFHKTSHLLAILICKRLLAKRHRVLKLLKKFHKNPKTCDMHEAVSKKGTESQRIQRIHKKIR